MSLFRKYVAASVAALVLTASLAVAQAPGTANPPPADVTTEAALQGAWSAEATVGNRAGRYDLMFEGGRTCRVAFTPHGGDRVITKNWTWFAAKPNGRDFSLFLDGREGRATWLSQDRFVLPTKESGRVVFSRSSP